MKKGKGFLRIIFFVIIVFIIGLSWHYRSDIKKALSFFSADKKSDVITEICADIDIKSEMVGISADGDILKLDFQNPGLDTYSLYTVIYSLKSSSILSKTDFGTADFATGLINGGFYVAKLSEKTVDFYDYEANKTKCITIPASSSVGMISVSPNGKYICFSNNTEALVYTLETDSGKTQQICSLSGYAAVFGTKDESFYLQMGSNDIITVNAQTGEYKKASVKKNVNFFTPNGCAAQTDDGFEIFNLSGTHENYITVNKIDEIAVSLSVERLLSTANDCGNNILTAYSRTDNSYFSYQFNENILSAVDLQNGYIAVSAVKEYGEKPKIYLLDCKNLKTSELDNQQEKPETVNEEEKVTLGEGNQAERILSDVPVISQYPDFPTGCESVSAVIAMRYAGDDISVDDFVDKYIDKSSNFYSENGINYGPDPSEYFIGSPRSGNAYGCMSPVIEKAMNKYYSGRKNVQNLTGTELSSLCSRYIDKGIPCLVWVSIGMIEPYYTRSWTLQNGDNYRWLANEHCMVLIGYDEEYYYFSDPYKGAFVKYQKQLCTERYKAFGKQAIAVSD